jgi:hypothetical protein
VLQREWDDRFSAEPHKVLFDLLLQAVIGSASAAGLEVNANIH